MKAEITRELLRTIKPGKTAIDVVDTKIPGFTARVMPSGMAHFAIRYTNKAGKQMRHSLKRSFPTTSVSQARELATIQLGKIAAGEDPHKRQKEATKENLTLFSFIDDLYGNYLRSKVKSHADTIRRLKTCFANFSELPLHKIDALAIEKWRSARIADGKSAVTVNRDLGALRPLFSRAVEWKLINEHPLKVVRPLKSTADPIVRFLSVDEEKRLRAALAGREARYRQERAHANAWRAQRRYDLLCELDDSMYADYLMPAVLLSLNTGIRQGELLQLRWTDVTLDQAFLRIRGDNAKSGKGRHVPLNTEAKLVLQRWHAQRTASELVFPGHEGAPMVEVKTGWKNLLKQAEIENFRWHDMRHHFASHLVMAGVDLNTVRELLGHADLSMTLRYAHLAPEHKASAVEKLMQR